MFFKYTSLDKHWKHVEVVPWLIKTKGFGFLFYINKPFLSDRFAIETVFL